ncbi:cullin-like protein [Medicago truncatula]|uniref:Cullin-like protein n=1 Tax=Medicago truncatula TaxID=3880 RepID=A0A072V4T0_MEDTR|nr:cullin-like protein [Medicago truncatula]
MEEGKRSRTSFQKEWPLLKKGVNKFIDLIEGGVEIDNSSFTVQDYMSIYNVDDINSELLCDNYKKVFAKYINSKVLPSLRAKENEILLRELLKTWSNYKIITVCLSRLFRSLETYDMRKSMEHSLEEIGFLSFYDLVYLEVNTQVMNDILAMIAEDHAGKQIDRKLINNILAFYLEIGDKTGKIDPKYVD